MLTFKQFLNENVKFKTDNPGGDWLKRKQEKADQDIKETPNREGLAGKGLHGSVTGYFTHPVKLPTKLLHKLPGANDEHKYRNDMSSHKQTELHKSVEKDGFDTSKHPVLIRVNHLGRPHIMEGNHRIAYAHHHGHEYIHAEVQYVNGGEEVKGQGWHPDQVLDLHHHGKHLGIADRYQKKSFLSEKANYGIKEIPYNKNENNGWYHDLANERGHHTVYHATHVNHLDSVHHNGINRPDPTTGMFSTALHPNVASGYASMSGAGGQAHYQKQAKPAHTPHHERAIIAMHIPKDWHDKHVDKNLGGNKRYANDPSKSLLHDRAHFDNWKKEHPKLPESHYYDEHQSEIRYTKPIPREFIKGYMIRPVNKKNT